jgi:hypothetical protein
MKIVLLVPYFGNLPDYFDIFLYTCSYNKNIDWIIFCDTDISDVPKNVKVFTISLDDFNKLASKKLGLKIQISKKLRFKICDLRPSFGVIFEDYLKKYHFWGHCDIDVIWGDIDKFITPKILANYDLITSRLKRISGHFCLYRNVPKMNNLYLKIPRYKYVFRSKKHFHFDETYVSNYIRPIHVFSKFREKLFGRKSESLRVFWDSILTTSGLHQKMTGYKESEGLSWIKGKAYNWYGHEIMYIHFHKLKSNLRSIDFDKKQKPGRIYITKDCIKAY